MFIPSMKEFEVIKVVGCALIKLRECPKWLRGAHKVMKVIKEFVMRS